MVDLHLRVTSSQPCVGYHATETVAYFCSIGTTTTTADRPENSKVKHLKKRISASFGKLSQKPSIVFINFFLKNFHFNFISVCFYIKLKINCLAAFFKEDSIPESDLEVGVSGSFFKSPFLI